MVNSHWGDVVEDNAFGTHEFMDLCELLGADPYVSGNVGSGIGGGDVRVGRVPDPGGRLADGGAAAGERARRAVAGAVLGSGQRGVGLRRQPARRAVRRRWPGSTPPTPQPWRQPRCTGSRPARTTPTTLDRDADALARRPGADPAAPAGPFQAVSLHYYTMAGPWADKGDATGFSTDEWYATMARARRMDELLTRPLHGHGPLRPAPQGRPGRGRVGHLVERGEGHQPRVPVPAEHAARRPGRLRALRRVPPPCRAGGDGEHRPDRQRAAGHDPHRPRHRRAGAHPDVPRVRDEHRPPRRRRARRAPARRRDPRRRRRPSCRWSRRPRRSRATPPWSRCPTSTPRRTAPSSWTCAAATSSGTPRGC